LLAKKDELEKSGKKELDSAKDSFVEKMKDFEG